MPFFRSFALACAPIVAAASVLTANTAQAGEATSGSIRGYRVNVLDSGSRAKPDYIEVYGPRGLEQIIVTCSPFDWSANGPHTAQFADYIADAWCFG